MLIMRIPFKRDVQQKMRKAKCTTSHTFDSKITGLVICNVEARGRPEERVGVGGM